MKKLTNKAGQYKIGHKPEGSGLPSNRQSHKAMVWPPIAKAIDLQALKESEARFRNIVLWSPDAIIVTDAKGKIEYMNPAAEGVFNRKVESFIGKDFGLPLVDGESTEIDIFRPGKDPGVGDMHTVETEWLNKKAHLIMIRDITEHKKTEQIVKEMQEKVIRSEKLAALGKLAGAVGHELRNPLGVIRNSVYFLRLKLASAVQDEKIKKHLDILNEEVVNSDRIITNILTFGRVKIPELALVDILKVIQASLEKLKVPAGIEVTRQFEPGLPQIQADEVQLQQVFSNIMLNAIQAMSGGGRLTISTKMMGEFIELDFADTGEGILKENLKKIFEPLFSTRMQGTGLGLTVCQGIIEAHKGNISVESEKGKGTKFTIKLPITKEV